jgi:hypothetical protein
MRTAKFLGLPILVFGLLQADSCYPVVRFSNDLANFTAGTINLFLPFLAALFALTIPRRWLTSIIVILLLLPLLCFSALGLFWQGMLTSDALRMGQDPAFTRVRSVSMGSYSVGVFISNCGAPCSFDIDLLQERPIIPGILLVRRLRGFEGADAREATCQVVGRDTLMISVPGYDDKDRPWESVSPRSQVYHLKPFLYF